MQSQNGCIRCQDFLIPIRKSLAIASNTRAKQAGPGSWGGDLRPKPHPPGAAAPGPRSSDTRAIPISPDGDDRHSPLIFASQKLDGTDAP